MASNRKPHYDQHPDHRTGRSYVKTSNGSVSHQSPLYNGSLSVAERLHLLTKDKGNLMEAVDFKDVFSDLLTYHDKYGLPNTGRSSTLGKPASASSVGQTNSSTAVSCNAKSSVVSNAESVTHRSHQPVAPDTHARQQQPQTYTDTRACQLPHSNLNQRPVLSLRVRLGKDTGSSYPHNTNPGQQSTAPDTSGQSNSTSTRSHGSKPNDSLGSSHVKKPHSRNNCPKPAKNKSTKQKAKTNKTSPEMAQLLEIVENDCQINVDDIVCKVQSFGLLKYACL